MKAAEKIITLASPRTPLYDVRILWDDTGHDCVFAPVNMVMYLLGDTSYPWDTDMIVVEKRYNLSNRSNLTMDFYWPHKDHGNNKNGSCECNHSTCSHLGLWEGTVQEIRAREDFGEISKKRIEYLVKVKTARAVAKEKRLAKIAADPAKHEADKKKAKEKRLAKKLEKQHPPVIRGGWPGGVAPQAH